jgi:N-methylhydantoinase A
MLNLAVDIGGTFTDLFGYDEETGRIYQAKCLSTPADFAQGVFDCIHKAGLDMTRFDNFVHGSTVAINTAIERTGARTALVVTRGTRDVYAIGRGNRPEAYNIFFQRARPLAPARLTYEIDQRTTAWGEALRPMDEAQARTVADEIARAGAEAVAVCFLHSYIDPSDEARMRQLLEERLGSAFITASHEITRRSGEYERMSTTVLNAYIGPRSRGYLSHIEDLLEDLAFTGQLLIMQSNGGLMSARTAQSTPVAMMESGPVGGVMAAAQTGTRLGYPNTIAFDMGGTTAKSSLIYEGQPDITEGYYIGGYAAGHPAMMPVVDIVEVGTGGGSIAWIDDVGALKVGPRSAGADPGPICYRRGGTQPTVTDANVVLGRIGDSSFLGGEMNLARDQAEEAIARLGEPFGLSAKAAALSIVDIAVANMSLAVRGVSVERGFDPRDFAMVAMGGAGPVHALPIARELDIPTVIIPVLPAHFSAVGMLASDIRHDYVRTHYSPLAQVDFGQLAGIFQELVEEGVKVLAGEGVPAGAMSFQRYLDLRYEGQEFSIKVPVSEAEIAASHAQEIRERFDAIHDRSYGHAAPDEPLEMVNVRVAAIGAREKIRMPAVQSNGQGGAVRGTRAVWLGDPEHEVECAVYAREALSAGEVVHGPAVIEEYASTTLLFERDVARVAGTGELIITVGARA